VKAVKSVDLLCPFYCLEFKSNQFPFVSRLRTISTEHLAWWTTALETLSWHTPRPFGLWRLSV